MSFNSGPKAKENHESWESLFRRTLSKERLFTFTRPAENPFHWMQLLDPFDQHDTRKISKSTVTHGDLAGNEGLPRSGHMSGDKSLPSKLPEAVAALAQAAAKVSGESRAGGPIDVPGWPLIPFSKVQMFKCEKCCLEFCSPINHRRHLRMIHRRTSHAEKEDRKSQRQQFATFWDNLSPEEAYKIAAVRNLEVEDLTGEKVVRALTHFLQQPSLFALPHSYMKSGAMLLELVKSRSSRIFLTSSELFKILDGSSEKTFPSFGLNAMQRYVFEGGAGKVGLETKNLVASLSFLVENNLVKAFIKDKDEEAWRCQTALVEEEEASRRKQAQIQARKDMKKVRQKDKENKASDSAMQRLFDADTSDDEVCFSSHPIGSQTTPSSNTFDCLNHKLAGEGSDLDRCPEVVSSAVCSPAERSLMLGDSNDVVGITDEVGIACKALESETKDSSNLPAMNEGSPPDTSGVQKPSNFQKRKYHAERSLSVIGEVSLFPNQKQSWKERGSVSARKWTSGNELEEDMDSSSSCFPRAVVRDHSANQVEGFRPGQHVAKPLRLRNYQAATQKGAAIWTKKMPKCADATSAKISHHTELANEHISPDVSDSSLQADGNFESSGGVSSTAAPHDRKSGSLFTSSTTACPNIEPPLSSASSNEQVNVPTSKTGGCNPESSPKACFVTESGQHYQGGHNSASITPVVIGSVVIGSVSVPLTGKDSAQACKVVDASERELAELVDPPERTKETWEVLHENGVINSVSHRHRKGDEKSFSQSDDAEWKENKEHFISQAGMGKFMKPTVVQGSKIKVWRPVVSNTHHDGFSQKLSDLGVNNPETVNKVSSNQSLVIGRDINDKELEKGQTIQEDSSLRYSLNSDEAKSVVEGSGSDCTPTFKALAYFLSQRWSDALRTSDSVVLSVEDEKGCARQCCDNTVDVERKDTNAFLKDSKTPSSHLNKEANNLSGGVAKIRGLWKQGCSGSEMAVNRRMTGKDSLHFTYRYAGYKYVPK